MRYFFKELDKQQVFEELLALLIHGTCIVYIIESRRKRQLVVSCLQHTFFLNKKY